MLPKTKTGSFVHSVKVRTVFIHTWLYLTR